MVIGDAVLNRRNLLQKSAALGATVAATGMANAMGSAEQAATMTSTSKEMARAQSTPALDGQELINRERAYEILDRFDLQGLIALDPINVYYLTNVETVGVRFRTEFRGFGTFSRLEDAPTYLVAGMSEAWNIANQTRQTAELMPHGFGGGATPEIGEDGLPIEPDGANFRVYHVRDDVELTSREQRWSDAQDTLGRDVAVDRSWALARALKAQGITRGRVAVDDMRIADFLAQTDLVDVECVPGYGVFQLIRMVKSEQELAYQRVGGWNNGEACLATIRAIEPGMTEQDVTNIYRIECAKRGNDVSGLIVGLPGGGFPDGEVVKGKPYLIDAVSHFRHYHGDTARTFVVGEPSEVSKERFRANSLAREAVMDALKPGTRFSDLRRIGFETMVKAGMPEHAAFVTPHTVGLQHSDHARRLPQFGLDRIDHMLEENMVLTVDLPFLEVGWGAGHNEDLIRITKTGYELFSSDADPYIVL